MSMRKHNARLDSPETPKYPPKWKILHKYCGSLIITPILEFYITGLISMDIIESLINWSFAICQEANKHVGPAAECLPGFFDIKGHHLLPH